VLLRLPLEVADLFREWLQTHQPLRARHVMSMINQMRGGRDNDSRFGIRMRGTGLLADLIERRFSVACKRLGLNTGLESGSAPPVPSPEEPQPAQQLPLFD